MAYPTPAVTVTTADKFIPEIWSDEIVASYKKNLVLANIVMKMNFKGKKGDTVHIPAPTRGSASAKAASTAVTLIADTETGFLPTSSYSCDDSGVSEAIGVSKRSRGN